MFAAVIGPGAGLLILFFWLALPFLVLYFVATNRGESPAWMLLALLGWLGVIIGLIILLSRPQRRQGF